MTSVFTSLNRISAVSKPCASKFTGRNSQRVAVSQKKKWPFSPQDKIIQQNEIISQKFQLFRFGIINGLYAVVFLVILL